jgi:hypothetical protein
MRIALASDHAGFALKDELAAWLRDSGHIVIDLGTNGPDSVDYPEFGARLAKAVASREAERGNRRVRLRGRHFHRRQPQSLNAAAPESTTRFRPGSPASITTPMCWHWALA